MSRKSFPSPSTYPARYSEPSRTVPIRSGAARRRRSSSRNISSMPASSSSVSLKPSPSRNFIPLYSAGLCEALTTAPPLNGPRRAALLTPGVGMTPRSTASPPDEAMPAMSADWSISPESLVSRPTAILGRSTPFSMRNTAYAEPRRIAASGVIMPWFAMSRTPSVPKNCLFFPFASFKRATSQSKIYILSVVYSIPPKSQRPAPAPS